MSSPFTAGHAVIIGVGADLPGTIADATALADLLRDPARCAFPPAQVHLLTGPASDRAAILNRLEQVATVASPEATCLFFFSGHGCRVNTPIGPAHFLIPSGCERHNLTETAISDRELADRLAAIPAARKLVLLDCCHAGGFDAQKTGATEFVRQPLPPAVLEKLGQGRGVALIASSRADEYSFAGEPYSAFTLALLEALAGEGNARRDGFVRVADIALHTRQVVPARTAGRQHPILHFAQADNFAVAWYAAGDTTPKGVPFNPAAVTIEPEPGAWRGAHTPSRSHAVAADGSAISQGGGIAVAAGGVVNTGWVGGSIVTGDGNTVTGGTQR